MSEQPVSTDAWPVVLESPSDRTGERLEAAAFYMVVGRGWRVRENRGREFHIEPCDGRDIAIAISVLPLGAGDFAERATENIRSSADRHCASADDVRISVSSDRVSGRVVAAGYEWLHECIKTRRDAILITASAPLAKPEWRSELARMVESVEPRGHRWSWRRGVSRR